MIVAGCFFLSRSYLLLFTDLLVDAFLHNPSRVDPSRLLFSSSSSCCYYAMVRRFQMTSNAIPHDVPLSMLNASFGENVVNFFDFLCAIKSAQPRRTLDEEFSRLLLIIAVSSGGMLIVCVSAPVIIRQLVLCCQDRSPSRDQQRATPRSSSHEEPSQRHRNCASKPMVPASSHKKRPLNG
jgi:hypothetical protein